MDNAYNHESMLLSFNTAVSLTDVKLGCYNTDSDITVYAYTASQGTVGGGVPVGCSGDLFEPRRRLDENRRLLRCGRGVLYTHIGSMCGCR